MTHKHELQNHFLYKTSKVVGASTGYKFKSSLVI